MILNPISSHLRWYLIATFGLVSAVAIAVWIYHQYRSESPSYSISEHSSQREVFCSENWTCGKWEKCSPEGVQTRECRDLNQCGTEEIKPTASQACEPFIFKEPTLGPFEIEIIGDESCSQGIAEALNMLESKAPEYYEEVQLYASQIKCIEGDISTLQYNSIVGSTLEIAEGARQSSLPFLASVIVHEMIHARIYFEYLIKNKPDYYVIPQCIYSGKDVEETIGLEQAQLLERLGGTLPEIDFVKNVTTNPQFKYLYDTISCEMLEQE